MIAEFEELKTHDGKVLTVEKDFDTYLIRLLDGKIYNGLCDPLFNSIIPNPYKIKCQTLNDFVNILLEMSDTAYRHELYDKVLCELVREAGHTEIADKFEAMDKWHA